MAHNITMPTFGLGEGIGTVVRWLKAEGDHVAPEEPVVEVETDKASVEIPSPQQGILLKIVVADGEQIPFGELMGVVGVPGERYQDGDEAVEERVAAGIPGPGEIVVQQEAGFIKASPLAKRLGRELGVDLTMLQGSGPGGRVVEADVLRAGDRGQGPEVADRGRETGAPVPEPAFPDPQPLTPNPLSRKRRITAERMSASARATARVTLLMRVDMTAAVRLRSELQPLFAQRYGVRLSYNDLLVRACAVALSEHPHMNAQWVENGIRTMPVVNIGVAMAVEDGLIVPVVRDAANKSLSRISRELHALVERARTDTAPPEELVGGTFTITNLGMYDVEAFTPIVNPPETAILGVGRISEEPVVRDGQVCVRSMMYLSLAFDHRVVDGAPAAAFLQRIKVLLESPSLLLVD